tara:strand:+ start:595 stop:900 length:306 start_codon:yes stop_codon:yes gene_type:complete
MGTYKPLKENVTIKSSEIDGLGLFATTEIEGGVILGVSHIEDDRFENGYIRTPLGGFINHKADSNTRIDFEDDIGRVVTKRKIEAGEEITLTYSLYLVRND